MRLWNGAETLIRKLHEFYETIRIGIVSGEFPDGLVHAIEMGGDFYTEPGLSRPFGLLQIQKGDMSQSELVKRGKGIWTPSGWKEMKGRIERE